MHFSAKLLVRNVNIAHKPAMAIREACPPANTLALVVDAPIDTDIPFVWLCLAWTAYGCRELFSPDTPEAAGWADQATLLPFSVE